MLHVNSQSSSSKHQAVVWAIVCTVCQVNVDKMEIGEAGDDDNGNWWCPVLRGCGSWAARQRAPTACQLTGGVRSIATHPHSHKRHLTNDSSDIWTTMQQNLGRIPSREARHRVALVACNIQTVLTTHRKCFTTSCLTFHMLQSNERGVYQTHHASHIFLQDFKEQQQKY